MKCWPVPSTSCDLCTSKVWCCYIPWLRRCIYKKKHYLTLTLGSRSYKRLPSTLDIIWPMHKQSLMLLHPTVKEKMHLQENKLFDLGVKVTWNVAQCPLHHVAYAPTEFEVTTSKGLGGYAFTRKFIILPWSWGQGHRKCCPVPSTSCDLFSYKVWSATSNGLWGNTLKNTLFDLEMLPSTLHIMLPIQPQSLKLLRLTVYEEIHLQETWWTDRRTDGTTDRLWYEINIRDLFHVYLNKFEFHFSRLHIDKTNTFCFFLHNGRVPGIAK